MEYTALGTTGLEVSSLCMGTMSFGGPADDETSKALFSRAREEGINVFDSADVYNGGEAERILGQCIKTNRDEVLITSKVCNQTGPDRNDQGLSRRHILRSVEASLRRLGTDHIDIYYAHLDHRAVRLESVLRAFDDLVRDGKILYPALSNWSAWRTGKALAMARNQGYAPPESIQPMYSLVKRQAEVEILPMAAEEGLGVFTYSPLGGGLLTGKYEEDRETVHGRLTENEKYRKRYRNPEYRTATSRLVAHAREWGYHPASLAVAWVMHHPAVTAPIVGARSVEQLEPSLAAANVPMTAAWREELSSFSPTPPNATDR
jgi:aryl-alcohol dehydrogenase-like predicted oxidoreductase